ncbi:MAG: site-2 protease family protein [Patescibacteria group bacterium]|nr:site-2 protease family protein [Patescibacteria group bacterium]
MIITILVFLLMLSVLVLVHEAGHFFSARRGGVKVEEFGFGLPPRIFAVKKGETLYSVNWLPIGGFVKLYGEDEAGGGKIKIKDERSKIKDMGRAFFAKSPWQRAGIVFAGVGMNVLLSVVIFYAFLFISGFKTQLPLLGQHRFFLVKETVDSEIIVNSVADNSPAQRIGIAPFSKIISINGAVITGKRDLVDMIDKNKGKKIKITWLDLRTHKTLSSYAVPRISPPKNQGALGIGFFSSKTADLSYDTPLEKIFAGFIHPANLLVYNFDVIGRLLALSIREKTSSPIGSAVAGPVGIFNVVGSIEKIPNLKEKILEYLNLAGLLSISLAFFNAVPIPGLDGGRLFFILIEAVTGKKINPKIESYIHSIGMVFLLILIGLITIHDFKHLFKGGSFLSP